MQPTNDRMDSAESNEPVVREDVRRDPNETESNAHAPEPTPPDALAPEPIGTPAALEADADERPPLPEPPRAPKWGPVRWTLVGLLFAACLFSRVYDLGTKAIMHDESLFVYYTEYQLKRAWTYNYMPILHGPMMIQLQAVVFHVFGDSTHTMRLGCALLGVAGFFLLFLMRPHMGEAATWAALVFYTVSTGLAFYARFFRNDALFHFWTLMIILCACRWFSTRSHRWLIGLILSIACMFCNKENSLVFYFSGVTFLLFWVIQDLVQWFLKGKSDAVLAKGPAPRPAPFPNVFWFSVIAMGLMILVFTRTFEGIKYDADVVRAIGHDYKLRDVRSLKLLLGVVPENFEKPPLGVTGNIRLLFGSPPAVTGEDPVAPLMQTPRGWRVIYGFGFLALLAMTWFAKVGVRGELGHKEVLSRFWTGITVNKWWFLGAVFLAVFIYLGIFTTWFAHPRGPFKIYKDTFGYWAGQHEWSRIDGPFHYQMVITLIYELPAVLLMLGGWMYAMGRTWWGRAWALPILGVLTLAALWYFNTDAWAQLMTQPVKDAAGKTVFANGSLCLKKICKATSGVHLYMIVFLSYCCVVLTWAALWRGQIFHAWLIWWTVSSIGAYSYAGEKVPWVGTHMMLPIILLAASYTGKLWYAWGHRHKAWFFVLFGVLVLWNAKSMVNACFRNSDDIRERIIYGHSSKDLYHHAQDIIRFNDRASIRPDWQRNHNDKTKLKETRVLVRATNAAIWPLRWYLRHIDWTEHDDASKAHEKFHFVFLDAHQLEQFPTIKEHYTIYRGRGRCFYQPRLPDWQILPKVWLNLVPRQYLDGSPNAGPALDARKEWKKLKDYMLHRHTFERAGVSHPSVSSVDYFFCVRKDIDL